MESGRAVTHEGGESSSGPGAGAPSPQEAAVPAGAAVADDSATPAVLIVDDEPAIRAALRRYFQRRGWRVDEAADGRAALGILRGAQPEYDVVLCDLCIPALSGAEPYDWLAAESPHLARRLVFSTGDITGPDAVALLARTGQPVLEKPFDLDLVGQLADRIRSAR